MGQQSLVFWEIGNETLQGSSDHSVLAHQDDSLASERRSDLVHLLRGDIVDADDKDGLVLVEQSLQLVEVDSFGTGLAPHDFFEDEVRMFKGKGKRVDEMWLLWFVPTAATIKVAD